MKNNLLKFGLIGLLCSGVLVTGSSCSNQEFDPLSDGVLTIGLECAYSPFNYTELVKTDDNEPIKDATGEYAAGYDILVAKKLAEDLGVKLEIVRCEWDGLIPSLNSKRIDAIIAGMTDTPLRRNSINFTNPYYSSQLVIVTKTNEETSSYTKIEDFSGKKFIAQIGTVQADLIDSLADSTSDNYAGIIAGNHTYTYPESFMALTSGTVDAVVCETPVAADFLKTNSGYSQIVLENNDDFIVSVSIGVNKKANESFLNSLNSSLGKISQSEREEMMNKATSSKN